MLSITELRKDTLIQLDGEPYRVVEYSHTSLGRGGAVVRLKVKNLKTGAVTAKTFKGNEKVEAAQVDHRKVQYLYSENTSLVVMDLGNYEQYMVPKAAAGEQLAFMKEGMEITGLLFNGEVVGLDLPKNISVQVTHTEPGFRGDTATAALKPCTVETGATVQVPLFINTGDIIKVDTRTGQYLGRDS